MSLSRCPIKTQLRARPGPEAIANWRREVEQMKSDLAKLDGDNGREVAELRAKVEALQEEVRSNPGPPPKPPSIIPAYSDMNISLIFNLISPPHTPFHFRRPHKL